MVQTKNSICSTASFRNARSRTRKTSERMLSICRHRKCADRNFRFPFPGRITSFFRKPSAFLPPAPLHYSFSLFALPFSPRCPHCGNQVFSIPFLFGQVRLRLLTPLFRSTSRKFPIALGPAISSSDGAFLLLGLSPGLFPRAVRPPICRRSRRRTRPLFSCRPPQGRLCQLLNPRGIQTICSRATVLEPSFHH